MKIDKKYEGMHPLKLKGVEMSADPKFDECPEFRDATMKQVKLDNEFLLYLQKFETADIIKACS